MSLKIALCQIENQQTDLDFNVQQVMKALKKTQQFGVDLVVFPELFLTGYLAMDAFLDQDFISAQIQKLLQISQTFPKQKILIGAVTADIDSIKNSAVLLFDGQIQQTVHKENIPNDDIFFEKRYFKTGEQSFFDKIIEINGVKIGVQICEDLWDQKYDCKVSLGLKTAGAELILNLSASPFWQGKLIERKNEIQQKIIQTGLPFIYLNSVGSGDGYDGQIIFDGASLIANPKIIFESFKQFEEDIRLVKFDKKNGLIFKKTNKVIDSEILKNNNQQISQAIQNGIYDYFYKNKFQKILVAVSGGIDSALVLTLAKKAIGADKVLAFYLPTKFNSQDSQKDSQKLCQNLGLEMQIISIENFREDILKNLDLVQIKKASFGIKNLTNQNLQARLRSLVLMYFSNLYSGLVLTTTNKTEAALGYGTLYGDLAGGLAPILDLNKTQVYNLAQTFLEISSNIILKKPSAELDFEQTDEQDLGLSYQVLSPLVDELICTPFLYPKKIKFLSQKYNLLEQEIQQLFKRISQNEFKRRQCPPGIKLTKKSFGIGRRFGL